MNLKALVALTGLAGAALAASAEPPLVAPGLYAVTARPVASSAGPLDLRALLPDGLKQSVNDDNAFETRECLAAQDVASLPDFAKSLHKPGRLKGCELTVLDERSWRARCGSFGMHVINAGRVEFGPQRFVALLTTTVGRTTVDTLVTGVRLDAQCPTP